MTIFKNIAMGLLKAYVIASLAFSFAIAAVTLAPLFVGVYLIRAIRSASRKTAAGAVAVAKRAHARRVVYLHRILAVLLFAAYPLLFVFSAVGDHLSRIPKDMRDLWAAFRGDFAL